MIRGCKSARTYLVVFGWRFQHDSFNQLGEKSKIMIFVPPARLFGRTQDGWVQFLVCWSDELAHREKRLHMCWKDSAHSKCGKGGGLGKEERRGRGVLGSKIQRPYLLVLHTCRIFGFFLFLHIFCFAFCAKIQKNKELKRWEVRQNPICSLVVTCKWAIWSPFSSIGTWSTPATLLCRLYSQHTPATINIDTSVYSWISKSWDIQHIKIFPRSTC